MEDARSVKIKKNGTQTKFKIRCLGMNSLWGASVKIGTMRRRLAWPLRKDDTHESISVKRSGARPSSGTQPSNLYGRFPRPAMFEVTKWCPFDKPSEERIP